MVHQKTKSKDIIDFDGSLKKVKNKEHSERYLILQLTEADPQDFGGGMQFEVSWVLRKYDRAVGVVIKHVSIGAGNLEFDSWAGYIKHCR